MKKKKEHIPKEKKLFSNKKLAILSIALVAVIVSGLLLYRIFLQTSEVKFSFKAAIIDQLGEEFPNSEFNETGAVAGILKNAGFNVTYHRSETINVVFYMGLAKCNYGIIIMRAHAAIREGETIVDFFTSEEYSTDRYVREQNNDLLTKGYYKWKPGKFYFTITPKFIENLEGYFPKSIVIAMGCESLKPDCEGMADAFIKKGAKAYIGWTDSISILHSDNSTVTFLKYLLVNNMTIHAAISECNKIHDPEGFSGKLSCYPSEIGSYKLSDLATNSVLNAFLFITQTHFSSKIKKYNFKLLFQIHAKHN